MTHKLPSTPPPQYNPAALVLAVQRLLAERGITVVVDLGSANTAMYAAGDLLRALGVAPTNAPMRTPTVGTCAERVAEQDAR